MKKKTRLPYISYDNVNMKHLFLNLLGVLKHSSKENLYRTCSRQKKIKLRTSY